MNAIVFGSIITGGVVILGSLILIAIKSNPKNKNSFFNDSIGLLKKMMELLY